MIKKSADIIRTKKNDNEKGTTLGSQFPTIKSWFIREGFLATGGIVCYSNNMM